MTERGSLAEAIEGFKERPMAVVIIGVNGGERIWLDPDVETAAQIEWAVKHIHAAASVAAKMEAGAGHG